MAELKQFEFLLLRYSPNGIGNNPVDIGVLMFEPSSDGLGFADIRFTRDWRRVRCQDPQADVEVLKALEEDLRRQLREGGDYKVLLKKIEESFSNTILASSRQACLAEDPAQEIEQLVKTYCQAPKQLAAKESSGRQRILWTMRNAFEQAGVWALLRKEIVAAEYTHKGDPLKIDCGYRANGVVKMFQAVALPGEVNLAKSVAFSYPQIKDGILAREKASTSITAVVESGIDQSDDTLGFVLAMMEQSGIGVARTGEMDRLADVARVELGA